jgi:hypothetical protein
MWTAREQIFYFSVINQLDALISQIYFVMKLYMFRKDKLSETFRVSWQNKSVKLVHLVGFITKKFVTMHGNMNVKKQIHLSLHANKYTSIIYYLKSGLIKIKTPYSLIVPTCFDTTRVIIREHSFFLSKITD